MGGSLLIYAALSLLARYAQLSTHRTETYLVADDEQQAKRIFVNIIT